MCEAGSVAMVCQDGEESECVPESSICNLNAECSDASDETNCEGDNYGKLPRRCIAMN